MLLFDAPKLAPTNSTSVNFDKIYFRSKSGKIENFTTFSVMGCWSSAKKHEEDEEMEYDKAVLALKVSRDKIKKYQSQLESDAEKQLALAKKLAKEKKMDKAKMVMKAKIARESTIAQCDSMLANIQKQLDDLDNAMLTKSITENLAQTNAVLKKMNEKLTVEMVEEMMDENAEQAEKINEIAELLGTMSAEDEATAEEEYEKMLRQLEDEEGGAEGEAEETESEPEEVEKVQPKKELFAQLA